MQGKAPQTLGCFPSPRLKKTFAVGDLHASGQAGAAEFGLLTPSPSKMDLSRFSFSAKEGDPITARRAPSHMPFARRAMTGHQVSSAQSSPGLSVL